MFISLSYCVFSYHQISIPDIVLNIFISIPNYLVLWNTVTLIFFFFFYLFFLILYFFSFEFLFLFNNDDEEAHDIAVT